MGVASHILTRLTADHLSHDLVPGNDSGMARRKLTFGDVQIGAADPASPHAQEHMSRFRLRSGHVLDLERSR
jgi:hypothetical protein